MPDTQPALLFQRARPGRNALAAVLLALVWLFSNATIGYTASDGAAERGSGGGQPLAACSGVDPRTVVARNLQLSPSPVVTLRHAQSGCSVQMTVMVWRISKPAGSGLSQAVSLRGLFETGQGEYAQAIAAAAFDHATAEPLVTQVVDVAPGVTQTLELAYPDPCASHLVAAYLGNGVTRNVLESGFVGPQPGCSEAQPAKASVSSPARVVATYFYYWYDLPRGIHARDLTDRPTDQSASYRDVAWFKRQFADMTEAGIDLALATYWGSAEVSSDVGAVNMGRAAAELTREGRVSPKVAMFLDTGAVAGWPLAQRDFTKAENRERLYSMVKRFHEALPREQWGQVDGKTVLWAAWFDIKFDERLFEDLRVWFARDFGSELYIVGDSSWRFGRSATGQRIATSLDSYYEWGAALYGYREIGGGVSQVGPGYDERPLSGPGRKQRVAPRDGGSFYERGLSAAVASSNRFLAIETWNEYHEASEVAESVEYGRRYIELTRRYADLFKRG